MPPLLRSGFQKSSEIFIEGTGQEKKGRCCKGEGNSRAGESTFAAKRTSYSKRAIEGGRKKGGNKIYKEETCPYRPPLTRMAMRHYRP